MKDRRYALFGIIGPLMVYTSIVVSLVLSPWFNWKNNALSDLGHPVTSNVASIFNLGLFLAGFFLLIYTVTAFKNHAKYSSFCLLISAFLVQLLATFNEAYGPFHYALAVPHFIMLSVTSIVYTVEKRSIVAFVTFLTVIFSWLVYITNIINIGIAAPEMASKIVLLWIVYSAIKIYFNK